MAKNTAQKSVLSMFNNLPEKKTEKPAEELATKKTQTKKTEQPQPAKEKKEQKKIPVVQQLLEDKKPVNKGGRPNTRGELNVDSKRISLIVPTELFERIKDNCHGNMTKFITELIEEKLDKM